MNKIKNRKLSFRSESIRNLSNSELLAVGGGGGTDPAPTPTAGCGTVGGPTAVCPTLGCGK